MKPIKEVLDELQLKDVWMEAGFLAFIIVYLINIFVGTETNKRIAYAWAQEFTTEGSILERNFSHLGICECSDCSAFQRGAERSSCMKTCSLIYALQLACTCLSPCILHA